MLDFISSFVDKIGFFFSVILKLPSYFSLLMQVVSLPFFIILGEDFGPLVSVLFLSLISFLLIYFIVKLVLSLL